MFSKKSIIAITYSTSSLVLNIAHAQDLDNSSGLEANVKFLPAHCIVFREGQFCTEKIKIEWATTQSGTYCLYLNEEVDPLECWKDARQGVHLITKKITNSTSAVLRLENEQSILARGDVTIAWVYEGIRKNRATWRLF